MDYLGGIFLGIYIVVGVYFLWCFVEIAIKAGYSGLFGGSLIIPVVNIITLGILAFENWPIKESQEQKIKLLQDKIEKLQAVSALKNKNLPKPEKLNARNQGTKSEGTTDIHYCSNCGMRIFDWMNYCKKCGHKLKE